VQSQDASPLVRSNRSCSAAARARLKFTIWVATSFLSLSVFGLSVIANDTAPSVTNSSTLRVTGILPQTNNLGRKVTITVTDASALVALARQKSKQLALFVNGNELPDVQPSGRDLQLSTFEFLVERTSANKNVWAPLLKSPVSQSVRPLRLSVGVQGETPLPVDSAVPTTYLWVIGWNWWTISWLVIFSILLLIFVLCAIYSNVLKTPEKQPNGRLPYSLSRTQAAFWLFIVAISFVFIWAITGDVSTLNGSVLGLIGISAATYLAAAITEKGQNTPQAPLNPPSSPANPVPNAILKIQNIRFVGRFLVDLLSDTGSGGVSIHRFQIFVWTIVVGIIFMVSVFNELSMPELNGTLLALMGISSATYIGSKLNE
jgi:hypothetical protein